MNVKVISLLLTVPSCHSNLVLLESTHAAQFVFKEQQQ